jgi:tyrosine-protein phosphatase
MAATTVLRQEADSPSLKRSFSENESPTVLSCPSPKKVDFCLPSKSSPFLDQHRRRSSLDKTGRRSGPRKGTMQPPSPRVFTFPMPSFGTIIDQQEPRSISHESPQLSLGKQDSTTDSIFRSADPSRSTSLHQPRDSISTSASESTESSPTTTVSLDSSSMTEPSPGPSPESPASMTYVMNASRFRPLEKSSTEPMASPFQFDMQRSATPGKKARNLKNLAVNTSASYNLGRAIATAPLKPAEPERTSAPTSPTFVKPPTPPRRKLGNIGLTIMTPANNGITPGIVPPTPSITRPGTLRHFQSSPSLPLYTAGAGPSGGMTLPSIRAIPGPRGFAEITVEEEEPEQNFDVPQSREDKPESYPNGPIRIYESGVDLYYEPSAEVAFNYDVILNVASEVKNPFDVAEAKKSQLSPNVGVLAEGSNQAGSPTTPKATPISTDVPDTLPLKRPEYVHIPWEHNTDIVPDLLRLVQLIDDRVQQGKTVLVHCQCGVSRSASLIVAYGMYKNPCLSVQEAYDAVKKRSKWIGPNMSLIMQLQEFRNSLFSDNLQNDRYSGQMFSIPRKSSTLPSATTADTIETRTPSAPPTPRTAPLAPDHDGPPQRTSAAYTGPFSAGPVEPGTGGSFWGSSFRRSWGSGQSNNDLSLAGVSLVAETPYVDTKGHVVPMVAVLHNTAPPAAQHEPLQWPSTSNEQPAPQQTVAQKRKTPNFSRQLPLRSERDSDVPMPDAPPLEQAMLSPRSEEFHMVPLAPRPQAASFDMFNILSPMDSQFSATSTMHMQPPKLPSGSPPRPSRAAPLPPPSGIALPSFGSIFSPTSTSFPAMAPLDAPGHASTSFASSSEPARASGPAPSAPGAGESVPSIFSPTSTAFPSIKSFPFGSEAHAIPSGQSETKPMEQPRIDSLVPSTQAPFALGTPPRPNRRLRQKFSAPNLSECIKLQKIQNQLADTLPVRPAEAEEALLSPRAGNFVANPFHSLHGPILAQSGFPVQSNASHAEVPAADEAREHLIAGTATGDATTPVTPAGSNDADPRSPAQVGLSPITRNIWGMI